MSQAKYKRVLIKLSGEALAGSKGHGFDENIVSMIVSQIKKVTELGVQVGLVVGGGNFWRGRAGVKMNRTVADQMGMMATVINALALQDSLESIGVPAVVQTMLEIERVGEPYNNKKCLEHLSNGKVVIFACGTGSPYFTTDSGAALKALEMGAEVMLLAKNIDGIYSADPKTDKTAKKIDKISYIDFIKQDLKAMDLTAVSLCKDNNIPVLVFGLFEDDALIKAVKGDNVGTILA